MDIFLDNSKKHMPERMETKVITANNIIDAEEAIRKLIAEGYRRDNLYVIAHSYDRADHVAEHTRTNTIGLAEEGAITAIANLFRSRGDELRAKLRSMGVSKFHAEKLEAEMDNGKIVILAWNKMIYDGDDYNRLINYYPFI